MPKPKAADKRKKRGDTGAPRTRGADSFGPSLSLKNTTSKRLPPLPFEEMKNAVLGKRYALSLVVAGDALTRRLNRTYRGKDKPADVLSFPLSKESGEIFLNPGLAEKKAKKFSMSGSGFIGFLFIHGLLHLKGFEHGVRMERAEKRMCEKFGLK